MNKEFPWFPFNAIDWLNSKIILQNDADVAGVYIALMAIEWKEGSLPTNIDDVLSFMPRKYTLESLQKTWPLIQHKYTLTPVGWVHERLDVEKTRAEKILESRRAAGKKGAKNRWRDKGKDGSAIADLKQSYGEAIAEPEQKNGKANHSNNYIYREQLQTNTKLHGDSAPLESREENTIDSEKSGEAIREEKPANVLKELKEFYDWTHYEFDDEVWTRAQNEYVVPIRETGTTMLIGAYLLAMKKLRNEEPLIASKEFQKLKGQAKHCIAFFTKKSDGIESAGFRKALEYVRWYVSQEEGTYIANSGWTLPLMLSTKTMNEFVTAPTKKAKKNSLDKMRDINNAAGMTTEADRKNLKVRKY